MADIKPSILIVDDELSIRESFTIILGQEFNVITSASGEAALKKIIDEKVDLVFLDVRMSGISGIDTLKRMKEIDPEIPVIMVTAVNDVGHAGAAIKLGARDYVVKPFDVQDILNKARAITLGRSTLPYKLLSHDPLVGTSDHIEHIRELTEELSKQDSSLLLIGETGVEVENVARSIADHANIPLKVFNVTPSTKEDELFGKEKGSFTDEFERSTGILEDSTNSLLLMNNIDLLPHDLQSKLKDAITKMEISRLGSYSKVKINVRIAAHTSADLKTLSENDNFDKGLYQLLSGHIIEISPLRTRQSDIPVLIGHYLELFNKKYLKKISVSEAAMEVLSSYPWPGNITELINTIEASVLSAKGQGVTTDDLPLDMLIATTSGSRFATFDHIETYCEKEHVHNALKYSGNNREKAANLLGMQLSALETKIESLGL
jgi:DNA-binding NtrC family response regulator